MNPIRETRRGSEMVVQFRGFTLKFEIVGRVTQRERRAMLLSIFGKVDELFGLVEPFMYDYEKGWIVHRDGHWENAFRDLDRGIKLRQALKAETSEQKTGF